MRSQYEELLLEIRQGLKDTEKNFKSLECVDLLLFREMKRFKIIVQDELINYRIDRCQNYGPKRAR